jgi:hypothetical protein
MEAERILHAHVRKETSKRSRKRATKIRITGKENSGETDNKSYLSYQRMALLFFAKYNQNDQVKVDEMDRACGTRVGRTRMHAGFW